MREGRGGCVTEGRGLRERRQGGGGGLRKRERVSVMAT